MNSALIQLLVLAGVAIFLILRLRNVLGTREGFEKPPLSMPGKSGARDQARKDFEVIEGGPDHDITDHVEAGSDAAEALTAMKRVDPAFNVKGFLEGARGAYEMILMAFEKGAIGDPSWYKWKFSFQGSTPNRCTWRHAAPPVCGNHSCTVWTGRCSWRTCARSTWWNSM